MTLQIPPLPQHLDQRAPNAPDLVRVEYLEVITRAITEHPRSQQVEIGPSEVGSPCARKLAHKLLGTPEREQPPNWKAAIGTGAHAWLESAFDADNFRIATADAAGQERWLIETKVTVGELLGVPITGSCDLYDRWTGTVIDHKTVGPTQLKKYARVGPGDQYRTQAHLYGRGWQLLGLPIEHVAIAFLPRNGELADMYWWSEPYDEELALLGLQRLTGVALAVQNLGPKAPEILPVADDYCAFCPFYAPGATDLTIACPGIPEAANQPALSLAS